MSQLPADFITQITQLLGADEARRYAPHSPAAKPRSAYGAIRSNPSKPCPKPKSALCPSVTQDAISPPVHVLLYDPLLHAGCYYVQEAASMFVEQAYRRIVADFQPHRLLDLCAPPGGKSTLWRSLLPAEHLLVANEPIRQRAQILAENLANGDTPTP